MTAQLHTDERRAYTPGEREYVFDFMRSLTTFRNRIEGQVFTPDWAKFYAELMKGRLTGAIMDGHNEGPPRSVNLRDVIGLFYHGLDRVSDGDVEVDSDGMPIYAHTGIVTR